ncbi:MAG: hypothetical protein M3177_03865 [Pseudomonadota bacterium]|nr:hypothetical protein [Pseudomonadota bacterium]
MDGKGGADTMRGGAGDDTYVVDTWTPSTTTPRDTVVESSGGGTDKVVSFVSYTLAANVENLVLSGSRATHGTGNGSANIITGNSAGNTLKGLAGSDTLKGLRGNDDLQGGAGADHLYGGLGNDVLRGDTTSSDRGVDRFYFTTAPDASSNKDTIQDFNPADDFIHLAREVFTELGIAGPLAQDAFHTIGVGTADAEDRIIYDRTTGALFYDPDGTGSAAAVQFASVTPGLVLSNTDFIVF